MAIHHWPSHERPREKLLTHGAQALSDAELLAIFLRVGIPGKNAVALAHDLLSHFGSLRRLLHADYNAFKPIDGIGKAKYSQLQASLEISKRVLQEQWQKPQAFSNPEHIDHYFRLWLGRREREIFGALFLDIRCRLIAAEELFQGSVSQAHIYPRELVRRALQLNAAVVVIAHNHPSGEAQPSAADIRITRLLAEALALVDIRLLDHIIIGIANTTSLASLGLIPQTMNQ